ESRYVTIEQVNAYESLLQKLSQSLPYEKILAQLSSPIRPNPNAHEFVLSPVQQNNYLNDIEWNARSKSAYQASNNQSQIIYKKTGLPENVEQGVFKPFWINEKLILARRVLIQNKNYIQGVWLNWKSLEEVLLLEIQDLLPKAQLQPLYDNASHDRERKLATLPVLVIPGDVASPRPPLLSSMRLSLVIAWSCVLLSVIAVGLLLAGTVALSERRATFVSSVTHELRTPLTTFRMYTEMLVGGMISSVEKRQTYLKTLQVEAERLSHLVENVLSYARIERGKVQNRLSVFGLKEFLERIHQRFSERTTLALMSFEGKTSSLDSSLKICADPTAVEQILFNLVDNACKYASFGKKIELEILEQEHFVQIQVRDYGPGFTTKQQKRLFRPFSKSAQEAAGVAPGVGLGLALSRRLARQMKGDLLLETAVQPGACFIVKIPKS
ncbi:MAG: HAMP domain-containing sensor histidine kinase, partial [Planctomycetota bacterium]